MRLWRARRRHDHIEAELRPDGAAWVLAYARNDRLLLEQRYTREDAARDDAAARLKDLQRAGWVDHW
jgi:hypothetical protein